MRKIFSTIIVAVLATTGIVVGVNQADAAPLHRVPNGVRATHGTAWNRAGYKPSRLTYGLDGTIQIKNIHWKSWGTKKAVGSGTLQINNCTPDCATSTTFSTMAVTVKLGNVQHNTFEIVNAGSFDFNYNNN